MRKISFVALLLFVVAVPAIAQPQYCFGGPLTYCQYIDDEDFHPTPTAWSFTSGSSRSSVSNPCLGGTTYAANLAAGGGVWQFVDTEDEQYWAVDLNVYFGSSGGNSDDKIYVEVTNITLFNQTEQHTISALDYGTCASVHISLSNSYDNSAVRIKVWREYDSTMSSIAVDNISFWGGPSN